jgi:hypothetical protein
MCLALVLALALALASVISYDRKWHCNLEHHLLTTLANTSIVIYDRKTFRVQAPGCKSLGGKKAYFASSSMTKKKIL